MKLNNPPAAKTHQVVMLGRGLHLIVMVCLIKVDFIHQPQFLELLQGTVNRRQAEAGLPLPGLLVELTSIHVPPAPADNLQKQRPLLGEPQSGTTQVSSLFPSR